jgi:hypothetical protein
MLVVLTEDTGIEYTRVVTQFLSLVVKDPSGRGELLIVFGNLWLGDRFDAPCGQLVSRYR